MDNFKEKNILYTSLALFFWLYCSVSIINAIPAIIFNLLQVKLIYLLSINLKKVIKDLEKLY